MSSLTHSPRLKASCAACRLRASAANDFCHGCRRVVCGRCAPLLPGVGARSHALTDHSGWKANGGRRPISWGMKISRRGAGTFPPAPRRGPLEVRSCARPWHSLFKPTQNALAAAGRFAGAELERSFAVGGTE